MKTWKISYETMDGTKRLARIKARTASEAVDQLCREVRVGNIFAVRLGREIK